MKTLPTVVPECSEHNIFCDVSFYPRHSTEQLEETIRGQKAQLPEGQLQM